MTQKRTPGVMRARLQHKHVYRCCGTCSPGGREPWGNNFALHPVTPSLAEHQGKDLDPSPLSPLKGRAPLGYPRGGALDCMSLR